MSTRNNILIAIFVIVVLIGTAYPLVQHYSASLFSESESTSSTYTSSEESSHSDEISTSSAMTEECEEVLQLLDEIEYELSNLEEDIENVDEEADENIEREEMDGEEIDEEEEMDEEMNEEEAETKDVFREMQASVLQASEDTSSATRTVGCVCKRFQGLAAAFHVDTMTNYNQIVNDSFDGEAAKSCHGQLANRPYRSVLQSIMSISQNENTGKWDECKVEPILCTPTAGEQPKQADVNEDGTLEYYPECSCNLFFSRADTNKAHLPDGFSVILTFQGKHVDESAFTEEELCSNHTMPGSGDEQIPMEDRSPLPMSYLGQTHNRGYYYQCASNVLFNCYKWYILGFTDKYRECLKRKRDYIIENFPGCIQR